MRKPVAVVTGGARGIGLAAGQALAAQGYRVVLADLNLDEAQASAEMIDPKGECALAVSLDVTSPQSVEEMVRWVVKMLGGLDALVNNAGTINPEPSSEVGEDSWRSLLDVHLGGTFRCSKAAFPALAASAAGAIVNVASIAARVGIPHRASYCAAKAGVEGLTRQLAVEWAAERIRVNAVAPGYTLTPLAREALFKGLVNKDRIFARVPMGRFGEPSELGDAIAFLASDRASYITGQTLVVDGGMSISGDW